MKNTYIEKILHNHPAGEPRSDPQLDTPEKCLAFHERIMEATEECRRQDQAAVAESWRRSWETRVDWARLAPPLLQPQGGI